MDGSSEDLGHSLRVLMVVNGEVSKLPLTHLLEKRGHQVVVANDGLVALAILQNSSPQDFDLVLMDIQMPRMSGLEAAQAVRDIERKTGGRVPIIAVSAHALPGEEEACRAVGMDAYLTEPIRADDLFALLPRAAQKRAPAASDPSHAVSVFDQSRFMDRLEGDEVLIAEIVGMFLDECPKLVNSVCQAVTQVDASALERAAHKLKGSVADMAAPQCVKAAQYLEQMGRQGDLKDAGTALQTLESAINQLTPELRKLEKKAA